MLALLLLRACCLGWLNETARPVSSCFHFVTINLDGTRNKIYDLAKWLVRCKGCVRSLSKAASLSLSIGPQSLQSIAAQPRLAAIHQKLYLPTRSSNYGCPFCPSEYRNAVRRFGSPDCLRNTIIACPLIPQLWPPEQSERRFLCEKRLPAFKLPPPVVPELRKC